MNALTVQETHAMIGLDEIERMANTMASSKLFGIQTPEQYMTLMFLAQAEGQHPATVAQDYDIIQGKPARKTHSVLARFQAAGGTVQWHDFTETKVSGTFTHKAGGSLKVEWTIEMAQKAQLAAKDNWKKTPRAMLRARCIAEGVRAVYPAALGGQLIIEEALDLVAGDGPIDITTGELKDPGVTPQRKSATTPAQAAVSKAEDIPFKDKPAAGADKAAGTINPGQVKYLQQKIASIGLDEEGVRAMLERLGIPALSESMTVAHFDLLKSELLAAA